MHLILHTCIIAATLLQLNVQPLLAVENPAAAGFDHSGSDRRAVEVADMVMDRLGGWSNWDATRHITWRFFGGRLHVWDKRTGNIRFEEGELVVLMNIHSQEGRAWVAEAEIENADSLAAKLKSTYEAWINDSYWLVMPYKLKDSGVTLKYRGQGVTAQGIEAEILELTFRDVGVTPQNRYVIHIDAADHLVRQWSFYREASDDEPAFTLPWTNWKRYGDIWLADDFGCRHHTDVAVFDVLPTAVFDSPEPIELAHADKDQ